MEEFEDYEQCPRGIDAERIRDGESDIEASKDAGFGSRNRKLADFLGILLQPTVKRLALESTDLVDGRSTNVIRSLRSLGFFNPPNAIFVPGMYFLGFSRYSN